MITGINHVAHVVPELDIALQLLRDPDCCRDDFQIRQVATRVVSVDIVQPEDDRVGRFFETLFPLKNDSAIEKNRIFNLDWNQRILLDSAEITKPEIYELQIGCSGIYVKEERDIPRQNACILVVGFLDPFSRRKLDFPTYELIEPRDHSRENDGLVHFLKKYPLGRKHHLALTVDHLEEMVKSLGEGNFIQNRITGKMINTGVHDTKTAFFKLEYSGGLLVELVEL